MSEVKQWLMSIGIPGIERLADEFESRGFLTRKSLRPVYTGDFCGDFSGDFCGDFCDDSKSPV